MHIAQQLSKIDVDSLESNDSLVELVINLTLDQFELSESQKNLLVVSTFREVY